MRSITREACASSRPRSKEVRLFVHGRWDEWADMTDTHRTGKEYYWPLFMGAHLLWPIYLLFKDSQGKVDRRRLARSGHTTQVDRSGRSLFSLLEKFRNGRHLVLATRQGTLTFPGKGKNFAKTGVGRLLLRLGAFKKKSKKRKKKSKERWAKNVQIQFAYNRFKHPLSSTWLSWSRK